MTRTRFWTVMTTLSTLVVAALAWLAPTTHGQVAIAGSGDGDGRRIVRQIEVLGGRGSSIGVTVRDVDERDVTRHKLPDRRGILIDDVAADSPAAKAGLKSGDAVVTFDGEHVRSARQFARLVEETPAGRTVKTTVVRAGSRMDVDVTPDADGDTRVVLGDDASRWPRGRTFDFRAMPDFREFERLPEMMDGLGAPGAQSPLGVGVQSLTPELAAYFGAKAGVLVSSVREDSPAARAGLEAGDVIGSVNGRSIDNASELRRELREADDATVKLGLVRDRKALTVDATLDRAERASARRRWTV